MKEEEYKKTKKFNSEVISEIVAIEKEDGLTAENLLERARDKSNPLHDFFEWNNSKAGEKWRLQQARFIINEVKIYVEDKEMFGFENVSVKTEDGTTKRVYKPMVEIISNESYRKQIIMRALQQQKYWAEQNKMYSEFKPIVSAIKKTEKNLKKKWQKKK